MSLGRCCSRKKKAFTNEDLNLPNMRFKKYVIVVFLLSQCIDVALSSEGDKSPFYQKCVRGCLSVNCTQDGQSFTTEAAVLQDKWSQLLQWSCRDECRYHCMWDTVQTFVDRGYNVPKFHGKWPFIRMYGVQEPASAFASLLNLLAHVYMLTKIVRRFPIRNTPLVPFWCLFGAVCIHAWIWSIIFHTRDNNFTEFMDYSCALSMVMALFVAAVVRILHRRRLAGALVLLCLVYYQRHVWYLAAGRVDYDYNMRVNVFFGAAGAALWVWWAARQLAAGRRYAWRVVCFAALSGAALALELLDFPPGRGRAACDAHALWHLATAPLPLLFYRFVIDDLHYLHSASSLEKLK